MGANHARVAMGLRDARVKVVVDCDAERAQRLAHTVGASAATDHRALGDDVDAAVLAVPTDLHESVGRDLLARGIDLLVEKPMAGSVDEAKVLAKAAEASGRILMVGHVERFNPAILELDGIIEDPIYIEARRLSPFTSRIVDGVTLDLMIHDLDLVRSLMKSPVSAVHAVTRTLLGDGEDLSAALLEFSSGGIANVTSSRLGQDKVRRLTITQKEEVIRVDLIRQDVSVHRVQEVAFDRTGGAGYRESGMVEIPFLRNRGEPLFLELEHFVQCVIDRSQPRVPAEDGIAALELVSRVLSAAEAAEAPE